ncbi:MAG TPA: DMT family transporter [Gemmatimonadaceae bacterium]|nr:DMT family transporter [Gemmatimonadaceae bacterium]
MRAKAYWVLALAVLGFSFGGPLVRLSNSDAITIAAWRLGFSLLIIGGLLLFTREWRDWRKLIPRELLIAVLAGVCLALHFWAWNASIHLTTIAASITLVNTQPAFVAAISAIALKERPAPKQLLGIAIAIIGAIIIAAPDFRSGQRASEPIVGNLLALSAAITAAIYYTIGRRLRRVLGLWSYAALVYSAALVALIVIGMVRGVTLAPVPPREMGIFAGLALGPMLLGHTGLNWALKFLPAYVVNLTVLGEPVGGTILGAVIPAIHQIPSVSTLIGGAVVLTGIIVTAPASRNQRPDT